MKKQLLFVCFSLGCLLHAAAAIYQWSVPLEGKDKESRAFLWIPPTCKQVRGVILANQVILEDLFCANPHIREACTKENLGIILIFRGPFTQFNYNEGKGSFAQLQKVLDDLATVSGYAEISKAPLLTVGHSGGANGAWNLANCSPGRVFGILTLHAAADPNPPYYDPKARIGCIPVMAVSGEYESWNNKQEPLDQHWRWLRGDLLDRRGKYLNALVCEVVQPGAGHFNLDDYLANICALFVKKAAHYRIPASTPIGDSVVLKYIDEKEGWYTDIRMLDDNRFKPTAAKNFKGDNSLAFWHFDEEMAKAIDALPSLYGGKKEQRVCFVQDGKEVPAGWINELGFEPAADGITIGVKGDFLKETPRGVANGGIPLSHSNLGKIKFSLIGGWGGGGVQVAPDSFRIQYRQFGTTRYCANIQVMAYHEGDATYKYAEQAGQIKFPDVNKMGQPQSINFPEVGKVKSGSSYTLQATSTAGMPVYYYVKEGPAIINGNQLIIDTIPPRSTLPIKLTIIAWQWGRSIAPQVQTAVPMEQVVLISE